MCFLLEAEHQQGERDLDAMMRRLKDLSDYSLTHAEIMDQREGVELLALGYPEKVPEPTRRLSLDEIIMYERWSD